jgi:hypothetical protein
MDRKAIPLVLRTISSFSIILRKRNTAWNESEKSIGKLRTIIKGKKSWEVKGTAEEAFNKVSQPIKELLDSRIEYIEEGEEIAMSVSSHMWMVGRNEKSALPTITFTSKSERVRRKTLLLVRESDLLSEFQGIALKALSAMPAVTQSGNAIDMLANFPNEPSMLVSSAPAIAQGARVGIPARSPSPLTGLDSQDKLSVATRRTAAFPTDQTDQIWTSYLNWFDKRGVDLICLTYLTDGLNVTKP